MPPLSAALASQASALSRLPNFGGNTGSEAQELAPTERMYSGIRWASRLTSLPGPFMQYAWDLYGTWLYGKIGTIGTGSVS